MRRRPPTAAIKIDQATSGWTVMTVGTAAAFAGNHSATLWLLVIYCLLSAATFIVVMTRCGLLSFAVTLYAWNWLRRLPLTLDTSAWYFGRSFTVLAIVAALALYGFIVSLGEKPVFGTPLLDE